MASEEQRKFPGLMSLQASLSDANEEIKSSHPLLQAVKDGDVITVQDLLKSGTDINTQDDDKGTALHWAADTGHVDIARLLCANGATVDISDSYGETPLVWSSREGNTECAKILLQYNANVNWLDNGKQTALFWASYGGHANIVELLSTQGAKVDIQNTLGVTALLAAAWNGHTKCAKILLNNEANINWQDNYNKTALLHASLNGHADTVELLCARGTEVDIPTNRGAAALLAAAEGHTKCAGILLNHNANINQQSKYKETALFCELLCVSWEGHTDTVELLRVRGAEVDIPNKRGATALLAAALKGHTKCVGILLNHNANINWKSNGEQTALFCASCEGHTDTVELLCVRGAAVDIPRSSDGVTALLAAAANGHTECVGILLNHNANINWQDIQKHTALNRASSRGHADTVESLCTRGADVDIPSSMGYTALIKAARNGHHKCVKILISHNATINWQNDHGCTALTVTSQYGHLEIVKMLIEKGADIELCDSDGDSPLTAATMECHPMVVKYLLASGANVAHKNGEKNTALLRAAKKGYLEPAKLLIEAGPESVDICDQAGDSPLTLAVKFNHIPCVKMLLDNGANVNLQNNNNLTALGWALLADNIDMVQLLQERGADTSLLPYKWTGNDRWTFTHKALIQACRDGSTEMVKFLGKRNIEINVTDEDGDTPLIIATKKNHLSCVDILLKHNADVNKQGDQKNTALIHASIQKRYLDILTLLLKYNADTELANGDENTPVTLAVLCGNESCTDKLLKHGADPTIKNKKCQSALNMMKENTLFTDIMHLPMSNTMAYTEAIESSWEKADVPSLILPFECNGNITSVYYKLIFGCEKIGWKCIEKSMNLSAFAINKENDTQLVLYPKERGDNCSFPHLQMDIYMAKTGNSNAIHRIPATCSKLENSLLLQVNRMCVTAPHVSPCLSGDGHRGIKPECLIKCSDLELGGGRFALARCPNHHKIIAGEKIAVWFKPEGVPDESQVVEDQFILDREFMEIAENIPLSVMERIAIRYMGARNGRLQIFREKHRENVEMATFDILDEWRNQHPYPESRQELYDILMKAASKGDIDGAIVQFLKDTPK